MPNDAPGTAAATRTTGARRFSHHRPAARGRRRRVVATQRARRRLGGPRRLRRGGRLRHRDHRLRGQLGRRLPLAPDHHRPARGPAASSTSPTQADTDEHHRAAAVRGPPRVGATWSGPGGPGTPRADHRSYAPVVAGRRGRRRAPPSSLHPRPRDRGSPSQRPGRPPAASGTPPACGRRAADGGPRPLHRRRGAEHHRGGGGRRDPEAHPGRGHAGRRTTRRSPGTPTATRSPGPTGPDPADHRGPAGPRIPGRAGVRRRRGYAPGHASTALGPGPAPQVELSTPPCSRAPAVVGETLSVVRRGSFTPRRAERPLHLAA